MIKNIFKTIESHFLKKKFVIFSPCSVDISNKSNISIKNKLLINSNWTRKLTLKNTIPCIIQFEPFSNIIVDKFIIYSGCNIHVRKNATLILDTGYINHNCIIDCHENITIGNKVFIGENVIIRDSDNHSFKGKNCVNTKKIIIEDNVWIGDNSIILKGVTIGAGAVVGAGSVVTKNVPKNCVVAGNPAKIIHENVIWI